MEAALLVMVASSLLDPVTGSHVGDLRPVGAGNMLVPPAAEAGSRAGGGAQAGVAWWWPRTQAHAGVDRVGPCGGVQGKEFTCNGARRLRRAGSHAVTERRGRRPRISGHLERRDLISGNLN